MQKGRIEIKVGQSGTVPSGIRYNMVKFPFTEQTPTIGHPGRTVLDRCQGVMDALTPHERDVVLMLLVNRYGSVVS